MNASPTWCAPKAGLPAALAEANTAFDLGGVVWDNYLAFGNIDLTNLIGRVVDGGSTKALAQTVKWCYTGYGCPYANAFWNGSQMYYGQGYAVADDVVGHEMTHGVTERESGLFYWGQSGAMNESISDIMGEIIDHRNVTGSDVPATAWALGEDLPGFPTGLRNVQDPTLKGRHRTGQAARSTSGSPAAATPTRTASTPTPASATRPSTSPPRAAASTGRRSPASTAVTRT